MLDPVLDSLDGVGDDLKSHYKQRQDGKFVLELSATMPGFAPKAQLDEFRNNNVQLKQDLEKAQGDLKRFEGVDPDEYKTFKESGGKKVFDEEEHNRRTQKMRDDHKSEAEGLRAQIGAKDKELDRLVIHNGITEAAIKAGARETAVVDIVNRVSPNFMRKDGKAVRFKLGNDGKPEIQYGTDGEPASISQAIEELKVGDGKHLFKSSSGDGASNDGVGANGVHTISRAEAKDPRRYQAAKEAAQKAGRTLEISE